ncbi:hypothetical protein [Nocardia sp. IFM 10818]
MNYDDITPGQPVTVTTRGDLPAIVQRKFTTNVTPCDGFGNPPGTEYVELTSADNGAWFFNYPHQLEPR